MTKRIAFMTKMLLFLFCVIHVSGVEFCNNVGFETIRKGAYPILSNLYSQQPKKLESPWFSIRAKFILRAEAGGVDNTNQALFLDGYKISDGRVLNLGMYCFQWSAAKNGIDFSESDKDVANANKGCMRIFESTKMDYGYLLKSISLSNYSKLNKTVIFDDLRCSGKVGAWVPFFNVFDKYGLSTEKGLFFQI